MKQRGFTLIELLIVIGIIGVIAGTVVVAISPRSQLQATEDAKRRQIMRENQNAIMQYVIDFGSLPGDKTFPSGSTQRMEICQPGQTASYCIDLETDLVADYLAEIPVDASATGSVLTGYAVYQQYSRPCVTNIYFEGSGEDTCAVEIVATGSAGGTSGGSTGGAGGSGGGGVTVTHEIDVADEIGGSSSIAIKGDGYPVIATRNFTNNEISIFICSTGSCSTNTMESFTSGASSTIFPTVAIGSDGFPVVAYQVRNDYDLAITHCGDAACSAGNTTTQISDAGSAGWQADIAIGSDNLPIIAHYKDNSVALVVTHCSNASCSSSTSTELSDGGDLMAGDPSIAIGSDNLPIISTGNATDQALRITHCGNVTCTSGNTVTEITDGGGDTIASTMHIAIGSDNLPVITYHNGTDGDVMVTHCSNVSCTSSTTEQITLSDFDGTHHMTIGNDGYPVIARKVGFLDFISNNDVEVIKCSDVTCSAYTTELVSSTEWDGMGMEVAIGGDNLPIISHSRFDQNMLRVTDCGSEDCS